jgi:excisionase family DNA binding protein
MIGMWIMTAQTPDQPVLLTRREVQRLFRFGHTKVYAMISSGELASFKDGRSRRI